VDLKIAGLNKHFDINEHSNFSLRLPDLILNIPSIVFVMGHNGSGKSVFLRLLSGDEVPSSGNVRVTVGHQTRIAQRAPTPIVRQNVNENLALDLTVGENLSLHLIQKSLKMRFAPLRHMKEPLKQLLKESPSLVGKLNDLCGHLSLGQKQALAFLAVTSHQLPILLLDEFLASTDLDTSRVLFKMATKYAKETPACLIIVSHDVSFALAKADRILVLNNGRLVNDLMRGEPSWTESFLANALQQNIPQSTQEKYLDL